METNTGKIKRLMKGQSESLTTLYSTKSLCVSGDSAGKRNAMVRMVLMASRVLSNGQGSIQAVVFSSME